MTQLRFGIRQMFPKGESLALMQDMGKLNSSLQSAAQMNHWLQLKKATEQTWYEAWYWHKNIALIAEDRVFLVQMLDFIQSLYQVGVKDQSDLIGAQLELIRLDERQIDAKRNYEKFHYELNALANETLPAIAWEEDLPEIVNTQRFLIDKEQLLISLSTHPKVKMLDEKLNLSSVKIDLVKQDFEPAWGVEVSYGLRDGDNMDGSDRANFLSAGVSVQVPLFTQGKQNHQLQGAKQRQTAAVLERDEMLRNSYFEYQNLYQQYLNTAEQRRLYEQDILPTLSKQKASAMQSYESDEGDFRLVSELYRKEQGARIMYQRLRVNELKLVSSMIYWLAEGTTHLNGVNAE